MRIAIIHNSIIPALQYGGIERVIWDLGKELVSMGHKITYLVPSGSVCPFADVLFLDNSLSECDQIPKETDLVHFHYQPQSEPGIPYLVTIHGNLPKPFTFFPNTCFVSKNHAERNGADAFVYNGLNWDNYSKPGFSGKQDYVHFLGKAAWKVKNVKDAIRIAAANKTEIKILGGTRVNLKMGFRFTLSKWASFYGMVNNYQKSLVLNNSKALVFPVLWDEPFGLALIESLYFGCPVLGTKRGSLPEIVTEEYGYLSDSIPELTANFNRIDSFQPSKCHEYALENFNSKIMARNYLALYEKILNGYKINSKNLQS